MRKLSVALLIMLVVIVSGCSTAQKTGGEIEMRLVDENLRLKEQIFDLQQQIEDQKEQAELERDLKRIAINFFYKIYIGDFEKAEEMVTDDLSVRDGKIVHSEERVIDIRQGEYYALQHIASDTAEGAQCLTFDLLYKDEKRQLNICYRKVDAKWRIYNLRYKDEDHLDKEST
ncbi:MAG: hypothetical protein ACI4XL_11150 [Bacillus sp. (in: firmicutes)]